jgi:hypothetical protein
MVGFNTYVVMNQHPVIVLYNVLEIRTFIQKDHGCFILRLVSEMLC